MTSETELHFTVFFKFLKFIPEDFLSREGYFMYFAYFLLEVVIFSFFDFVISMANIFPNLSFDFAYVNVLKSF